MRGRDVSQLKRRVQKKRAMGHKYSARGAARRRGETHTQAYEKIT